MKKIVASFILLLSTQISFSQDAVPAFIKDSLDNYVNRALAEWKIPGAAVCVVKDGRIAVMKGYGVKEMGTNDKVDENTLFMIGSNTKAFTATALAILEAENPPAAKAGKFSLDDKVQKWLPDFKLYDPWVAKEANIRDLLCHRLGFETFQGDFMFFDSDLSVAEVREKMGKLKPLYSFRSRWGYTNCAFLTAGEIIPKVTGKSWADYITDRIFKPLGMNNSLARSAAITTAENKATAHTVVMNELRKIPYGRLENMGPAGSISSSINDMSKWVMMQLDNGKLDNKEIVPSNAIEQTRIPHSVLGSGGHMFNRSQFSLYGLGWFLYSYEGRRVIAHTGGVNGFVTSVCLIPGIKLGIIVLTNTDANGFYEALRNEIQDAYLDLPYRNYSKIYLDFQKANETKEQEEWMAARDTIAMKLPSTLPIKAYTGNYVHPVYGKMDIKLEEGLLIMRFEHHKGRYGKLEPLGGNRFFCTYSDPIFGRKKLSFTTTGSKVRSLTVTVADFVEFTPYEFMKVN